MRATAVCALLALAIAGCASEPATRTVTVEVPVGGECKAPPAVVRPPLAIDEVVPGVTPDKRVIQAYAASIEALYGYAVGLEELLDGYRQPGHDAAPAAPGRSP